MQKNPTSTPPIAWDRRHHGLAWPAKETSHEHAPSNAAELAARVEKGSVVTLMCDSGERYRSSLLDDGWLRQQGIDLSALPRRQWYTAAV